MSRLPDSTAQLNIEGNGRPPFREQRASDLDGQPAPLIVQVGDVTTDINPWDLGDEDVCRHFRGRWADSPVPVVIDIRYLLDWDHDVRYAALLFIATLGVAYRVQVLDENSAADDLFSAVLSMMVGDADTDRCGRGRRAAAETAGLLYTHDLRTACSRIVSRLQKLHVRGFRVEQLVEEARAASPVTEGSASETNELTHVTDILTDAPVLDTLIVPPRWQVSAEGVRGATDREGELTITTPVLVSRKLVDTRTETEFVELVWLRPDGWHRRVVPRVQVATTRAITELAAYGLPVNSTNAAKLVEYLAQFEATNIEELPCEHVSGQLGWQNDAGVEGFLWGEQLITPTTQIVTPESEIIDTVQTPRTVITFRGADDGDDQLAAGFHAHGTFDGWVAAIQPLADFPRVRLAIYAALSTVVLRIVEAANFILSYSGNTSQGKTCTLKVAASCWGCPNERSPEAAICTWDATGVWIERASTVMRDLPLIIDDTKVARHPDDIPHVLYATSTGRARGRGSLDGTRGTGTFRTVLISSGEAPITSFSKDAGTRARVLELWGPPFGRADSTTAPFVAAINGAITANYGHAGPRLVQYLLTNQSQWPVWCQNYQWYRQQYVERAGDNSVAVRMAGYFATLELAAQLSYEAGIVPWPANTTIVDLWPTLTAETVEADQAEVALRHVWSWTQSHREDFYSPRRGNRNPPHNGWAGRWDGGDSPTGTPWEFVGFHPHRIEQVLSEGGFEPDPVLRTWRDREWVRVSERRRYYRCRLGGDVPEDLVAIERAAIEQLMGEEPSPPRTPRVPR